MTRRAVRALIAVTGLAWAILMDANRKWTVQSGRCTACADKSGITVIH